MMRAELRLSIRQRPVRQQIMALLRQIQTQRQDDAMELQSSVQVGKSRIPGAGLGVVATRPIAPGECLCLYPGIYSPGLPPWGFLLSSTGEDDPKACMYLGKLTTPSQVPPENNAYLLNLRQVSWGGYLDGLALSWSSPTTKVIEQLGEFSSTCGHLINHSMSKANVSALSIDWGDFFHLDPDDNSHRANLHLPNQVRADGMPWYVRPDGDIAVYNGSGPCCGAVIYAIQPLAAGQELLLDYELKPPLPEWAKSWYQTSAQGR